MIAEINTSQLCGVVTLWFCPTETHSSLFAAHTATSWAVCKLTGFESRSAAGLMYPCSHQQSLSAVHPAQNGNGSSTALCCLHVHYDTIRAVFFEAVSQKKKKTHTQKKLAVTLRWSEPHPLWTSTKWCFHCLSSCSLVDSKCQTSAISQFNNWYNKSNDYPCLSSVCASCCVLNYWVSFRLQRAGRSLL